MPRLHFQLPIDWGRDLIDAERLRLHGIRWLGKDDIPLLQPFCMDAVDTINKELRIYTGFINDTGKELPTIIAFEDILEIGVNMT